MSTDNLPRAVREAADAADANLEADVEAQKTGNPVLTDTGVPDDGQIYIREEITAPQPSQAVSQTQPGFRPTEVAPVQIQQSQENTNVTGSDREQELLNELTELRQKNKSLLGRVESQLKPANDENRVLRQKVQQLEEEISSLKNGPAKDVDITRLRDALPQNIAADDSELEMIARVAGRMAEEKVKALLPNALNTHQRQQEQASAIRAHERFKGEIEAKYPGFFHLDQTDDPRLAGFCSSPVPGTGGTVHFGDAVVTALQSQNMNAFDNLMEAFSSMTGYRFPSQGGDPRLEAQIRPSQSAVPIKTDQNGNQPESFKASDVARFNRDYTSGAILDHMTAEEAEQLRARIEDAELRPGGIIDGM